MRILLIEDNISFAEAIEKRIRAIDGCEMTWKKSKAGALAALDEEFFDVVILDRRIPTQDDFLDDDQAHGWAVFQSIVEHQPGTSVWFLTGTVDADFPTEMLNAHGRRGDIHCRGQQDPLYQVFWKDKVSDCVAAVQAFRAHVQQTEAIHLVQVGTPVNLRAEEAHLLKLFGRTYGGVRVELRLLSGGLSGARVLRVSVFNAADAPLITAVAKIGIFKKIDIERSKYRSNVVKLPPGSFPQLTAEIGLGAAHFSGIFYGIVGTEVRNLFDELTANPAGGAAVVKKLRAHQDAWYSARQVYPGRVSNIRRGLVSDVDLQKVVGELSGIDISRGESVELNFARCVQHGDLHCGNVVFDDDGRPMLIDYSDIGPAVASLDPVALELSTIFHRDAPDRGGWPSEQQAAHWPDIEMFCRNSPYEDYLRACRIWALEVAGSTQEILAIGYAYALRQLKYNDTDKALARAIISVCIGRLLDPAVHIS